MRNTQLVAAIAAMAFISAAAARSQTDTPLKLTTKAPAAAADFRAASQLMPADRLVAFAATGGVFSANLAAAKDLVARYPDYPLGYNSLAYLSWNNGDRDAALAAARRQVELNPSAPNPHDTYAEI